jgi:hypothetical protein
MTMIALFLRLLRLEVELETRLLHISPILLALAVCVRLRERKICTQSLGLTLLPDLPPRST